MALTRQEVATEENLNAAVTESARSLAQALAHSEAYGRFEAAQEALMADRPLRDRLDQLQARAQQLRVARMWGGNDSAQDEALQQELDSLADVPALREFSTAQEELRAILQDVTRKVTQEIGVDYGAACSPAGGCC
jgi:cell fate (sporulation/competence/biofilm development) regulator YlbF (YheA/YmcA/DUF963 family)